MGLHNKQSPSYVSENNAYSKDFSLKHYQKSISHEQIHCLSRVIDLRCTVYLNSRVCLLGVRCLGCHRKRISAETVQQAKQCKTEGIMSENFPPHMFTILQEIQVWMCTLDCKYLHKSLPGNSHVHMDILNNLYLVTAMHMWASYYHTLFVS